MTAKKLYPAKKRSDYTQAEINAEIQRLIRLSTTPRPTKKNRIARAGARDAERVELIRALGNVIDAYDNEREMSIERMADPENAIHEARVDEARNLLALVRP